MKKLLSNHDREDLISFVNMVIKEEIYVDKKYIESKGFIAVPIIFYKDCKLESRLLYNSIIKEKYSGELLAITTEEWDKEKIECYKFSLSNQEIEELLWEMRGYSFLIYNSKEEFLYLKSHDGCCVVIGKSPFVESVLNEHIEKALEHFKEVSRKSGDIFLGQVFNYYCTAVK